MSEKPKILLTGGTGLLGRECARRFHDDFEIVHFSRKDPGDGNPWIAGDVCDRAALTSACESVNFIVHAAALHSASWKAAGDDKAFEVNVTGTKNVLEAALATGVRRVIFTSSIWAAGHGPDSPELPHTEENDTPPAERYGMTKMLAERLCAYYAARHGLGVLVLRPGYISNPGSHNARDPIFLFGGVNAADVADAHVLALRAPESLRHDTFIITADSPLALVSKAEYRTDPQAVLRRTVPGIGPLLDNGEISPDALPEWYAHGWYSIARARRILGFAPKCNFSARP